MDGIVLVDAGHLLAHSFWPSTRLDPASDPPIPGDVDMMLKRINQELVIQLRIVYSVHLSIYL